MNQKWLKLIIERLSSLRIVLKGQKKQLLWLTIGLLSLLLMIHRRKFAKKNLLQQSSLTQPIQLSKQNTGQTATSENSAEDLLIEKVTKQQPQSHNLYQQLYRNFSDQPNPRQDFDSDSSWSRSPEAIEHSHISSQNQRKNPEQEVRNAKQDSFFFYVLNQYNCTINSKERKTNVERGFSQDQCYEGWKRVSEEK